MGEISPIIENIIRKTCDLNFDGKIEDEQEVSIFNAACESYNLITNTFVKDGQEYKIMNSSSENVPDKYRNKTVSKNVLGKDVNFTYNQVLLEDWVINYSTDKNGNKVTRFKNIPKIRKKLPFERTRSEKKLLKEFDNLIKNVIAAGTDYGIDPALLIAIIQKETISFRSEYGTNGNGYMQLTEVALMDILNGNKDDKGNVTWTKGLKQNKNGEDKYGEEMRELLKSKGFNIDCDVKDKNKLLQALMTAVCDKNDTEFNIRIGTLYLRYILLDENENEGQAAYRYNGNPKLCDGNSEEREKYASFVKKWYGEIQKYNEEISSYIAVPIAEDYRLKYLM